MERSVWDRLTEAVVPKSGGGSAQAEAAQPDYSKHPNYARAQKEATEAYFRTGEHQDLKDYINKKY